MEGISIINFFNNDILIFLTSLCVRDCNAATRKALALTCKKFNEIIKHIEYLFDQEVMNLFINFAMANKDILLYLKLYDEKNNKLFFCHAPTYQLYHDFPWRDKNNRIPNITLKYLTLDVTKIKILTYCTDDQLIMENLMTQLRLDNNGVLPVNYDILDVSKLQIKGGPPHIDYKTNKEVTERYSMIISLFGQQFIDTDEFLRTLYRLHHREKFVIPNFISLKLIEYLLLNYCKLDMSLIVHWISKNLPERKYLSEKEIDNELEFQFRKYALIEKLKELRPNLINRITNHLSLITNGELLWPLYDKLCTEIRNVIEPYLKEEIFIELSPVTTLRTTIKIYRDNNADSPFLKFDIHY